MLAFGIGLGGQAAGGANYFGSGADGDVTISSNTNLSATQDGDMVVKNYSSLTINSGCTLTTDNRCKGLLIYVKGNCTVNGTLTMTARGANVDPSSAGVSADGLRIIRKKSGGSDTLSASDLAGCGSTATTAEGNQGAISGNGTIFTIVRTGGSGATARSGGVGVGYTGGTATNGAGGGGSGGSSYGGSVPSGAGGAATCFSGGAGGGGMWDTTPAATAGTNNGGAGGAAGGTGNSGGGAGNPGGAGTGSGNTGGSGTGGLLILIVGGNLTIGSSGIIAANGVAGGAAPSVGGGGGGSGGGNVLVLYAGTLSNEGSVTATGGAGGVSTGYYSGGSGGAGSVQGPTQIDS